MTLATIEHVEAECKRFLERLEAVKAIEINNQEQVRRKDAGEITYAYQETGTRKHGAFRRAALDLKEALTLVSHNRDYDGL
jgi:hypothetical protein